MQERAGAVARAATSASVLAVVVPGAEVVREAMLRKAGPPRRELRRLIAEGANLSQVIDGGWRQSSGREVVLWVEALAFCFANLFVGNCMSKMLV